MGRFLLVSRSSGTRCGVWKPSGKDVHPSFFSTKKPMEEFIVAMALLQRRREAESGEEGERYQGLSWRGFRGPAGFVIVRIR